MLVLLWSMVLPRRGVTVGEHATTVTSKGQVTIPGEIRRALNIKPKDKVAFELVDGEVRLRPMKSAVLATYGTVKPLKPLKKPIDFRKLRREIQEEIADEVASEG